MMWVRQRPDWYVPAVIKDLKLDGLREYYRGFAARTHTEKVLIFATFLRDEKGFNPCTANQIYTCYRFVAERTPDALLQAIRDASKKKDYVDYQSTESITVTPIGDNVFLHDLAKSDSKNDLISSAFLQ